MIIIITGTPATGKTTLAKKLKKILNIPIFDFNKFLKDEKLILDFDKERNSNIIDEKKIDSKIRPYLKNKSYIIDSHLSHYIKPDNVKICIITKCNLKILKERLKKRRYKKEKIEENLQAEIFDTCNIEALEIGHKTIIIETDKDIESQLKDNKIIS